MLQGKFTVFTSVLAVLLALSGGINALQQVRQDPNALAYTLAFGSFMLWWLVAAALVHLVGRILDTYFREPDGVWDLWIMPFSLVALGLMGSAALGALSRAIGGSEFNFTPQEFVTLALGVVIAFVGAGTNAFIKSALHKRRAGEAPEEAVAKAP
jgi:uncharacterized membrane protein